MTKKEIVKSISEKTGLTQHDIRKVVQLTFEGIIETLIEEGRVEFRNFGVFQVKSRKARKARNPRTGRQVDVPEKFVVTFKPGKEMEARVQELECLGSALPTDIVGEWDSHEVDQVDGRLAANDGSMRVSCNPDEDHRADRSSSDESPTDDTDAEQTRLSASHDSVKKS